MSDTDPIKLIYLADDDADDRLLFSEAIKELGINAKLVMAHDGQDLMTLLDKVPPPPAIIFLDLNMPRKNGYECLAEIKQESKLKQIPVVIFSTSSHAASVDEIYEKGADYYICKPENFHKLKSVLAKMFAINFENAYTRPDRGDFLVQP